MDKEEDIKLKIFNTIHMNHNTKKKYFRIEKNKYSLSKENKSKAIFKTKKEYNFLNKKTLRDEQNQKINKNNKFITTTIDDTTTSIHSDNSFFVQNIIPKKLIVKEKKKEINSINYFSKFNENALFMNRRNNFLNSYESENNENKPNNINIFNYKIKLMSVYFYSIKNLCKYINKNLFNMTLKESKIIDDFLYQIYQDLQILNRKINEFKHFENMKENLKINKEDFLDITSLKQNLFFMKNILNNSMSQNLINIYINIENFCKIYSS
jgi:hypothetical protein